MARAHRLRSLLSALAAAAILTGCGSAVSSNSETHTATLTATLTSTSRAALSAGSARVLERSRQAAAPLTEEEKREYDANEGRCHDDRGSVRNIGTLNAYCAFPNRSDDFHLIESSQGQVPGVEEE